MLQRGASLLLLQLTLLLIIRIVTAVAAQSCGRQLEDARRLGQQLAVMAGDKRAASPLLKLLIEPRPALSVEMVGGFIKQEKIRRTRMLRRAAPSLLPAAQRRGEPSGRKFP